MTVTARSASMHSPLIALLSFIAVLGGCESAFAGPDDLDETFGDDGRLFIDIPFDTDIAATAILQGDGKLVIGRYNKADDDDFSVLRLNPDGSFDESFDRNGRTSLDYPGIKGTTHVVLQQTDGKIIAAGASRNLSGFDGSDFGMARYNEDGSVDTTFGVFGVVIHDLGSNDSVDAIVQQVDGRLVAVGSTTIGSVRNVAFVRFNTDGTLDSSFGTNGSVVINDLDGNGWTRWIAQQDDEKLLAAGENRSSVVVVRLNADGLPDPTFGDSGTVVVDYYATERIWGGDYIGAAAAWLEPDGKTLVAGNTNYSPWDYGVYCLPMLARLDSHGHLDAGFGNGGSLQYHLDHCSDIEGVAVAPDGDAYLSGGSWLTNRLPMVVHIDPDGNLDLSYGLNGLAVIDTGRGGRATHTAYGNQGVVRQPDGKIVVVASTYSDRVADGATIFVARLISDGDFPGLLGIHAYPHVNEALEELSVAVYRTVGTFGTVSVDFQTISGSATSGVDFMPVSGTLTWNDGDGAAKPLSISIVDDSETEDVEQFTVVLSNPTGGASLATAELPVEIYDDDSAMNPRSPLNTLKQGSGALDWVAIALLLFGFGVLRNKKI